MPQNKDRLYIALYARGGLAKMPGKEDTYHWALIIGPKSESDGDKGKRYHAKERLKQEGGSEWQFEERDCSLAPTNMLLVRIMIAKIEKNDRTINILRNTPVRQDEAGWNCVAWIKEALVNLEQDGKCLGTRVTEWKKVRDAAMAYCQKKKEDHRFDGKGNFDISKIPTYDLIEGKEIVL